MAETWIMVADYRKNSTVLGTNVSAAFGGWRPLVVSFVNANMQWKQGIPIEVATFAYAQVMDRLTRMGGLPILRMGKAKAGPVVSDNGNFIVDCVFPESDMLAPAELNTKIKMITGVVEVGLFCNMAKAAYFGNEDGSVTVRSTTGTETISSVPDVPVVV